VVRIVKEDRRLLDSPVASVESIMLKTSDQLSRRTYGAVRTSLVGRV
jgi:hypothetical protein